MKTLMLVLMLMLLGLATASSAAMTATQPATQPALKESEAVQVNGLDFQIVAPVVWMMPAESNKVTIPLKFKVTNQTDKDVKFDQDGACAIVIKDAAGKELPMALDVDSPRNRRSMLVAHGQSVTLDRTAQLTRVDVKDGTYSLVATDGVRFWTFNLLKVGRYTLNMTYESKDESVWVGKATSKEMAVEITDKPALSSKPAVKDGLSVTVTLPKATFAADEPLKFTVQFKNVSEKPFTLYDVDWFWAWSMHFEDVARKGSWQMTMMAAFKRADFPARACKPGETVEVLVDLGKDDLPLSFTWKGVKGEKAEPMLPLTQLKPGKYRLTMEIALLGDVRKWAPPVQSAYWTGKITTEPVEIEVTDNPASPATQPADANAAWKAVVAALEAGDKVALAKATTEKGYQSFMGNEGKTLTPEEMKVRGATWGKWTVQFSRKTDDAATANVVAPMTLGGLWVEFKKTTGGWKADVWAPGK